MPLEQNKMEWLLANLPRRNIRCLAPMAGRSSAVLDAGYQKAFREFSYELRASGSEQQTRDLQ